MLPKLEHPIYTLELISNKKKIRFRPFLVKEQKLFLMAAESDDPKDAIGTIKQIISNCLLDELDVNSLPIFDIEYLFLNLRARSVEEKVNLKYKCNNIINVDGKDKTCNTKVEFDLNLLEIKPTLNEKHSQDVMLTDKMGVHLIYPTFDLLEKFENTSAPEITVDIIAECIEYVFDEESLYYSKDSTPEEVKEFVESFSADQLNAVKEFFTTMPSITHTLEFKCPSCGYQEPIVLRGIQSFFV